MSVETRETPGEGTPDRDPLTSVDWTTGDALTLVLIAIALLLGVGGVLAHPVMQRAADVAPEIVRGGAVIGVYGVLLTVVWLAARRRGSALAPAVGLRRFSPVAAVVLGVAFALGARVLAVLWAIAVEALGVELPGSESLDVTRLLPMTPAGIAVTVLLAAVAAPLVEEVIFRGVLVSALERRHGAVLSGLVSAALFAVVHFNLFTLGPIFILGWWLAWLYSRTRSLWPSVVAHAAFNGIALAAAYSLRAAS